MSISHRVEVWCDGPSPRESCNVECWAGDTIAGAARAARQAAKKRGWHYVKDAQRGMIDLCAKCYEAWLTSAVGDE